MGKLYDKARPAKRSDFLSPKLTYGYPDGKLLGRYVNSEFWREAHQRYRDSGLPQRCLICDKPRVQLHHTDYTQLGREKPHSLRPLCRDHHIGLHQTLNRYGYKPPQTDEALRIMARLLQVQGIDERLAPYTACTVPGC